jgi:hypothetical protein
MAGFQIVECIRLHGLVIESLKRVFSRAAGFVLYKDQTKVLIKCRELLQMCVRNTCRVVHNDESSSEQ